ncbi:MAG: type IV toxin-antitoxin system AbiEi family antitoxin domain-containing protein [Acidimicrobiia bacterium]
MRRGDTFYDTEAAVAALAASQHGVFSRRQALEAGFTDTMIRRRVLTGAWVVMWAGVYSPAVVADSWRRRLMGVCLTGAVASHRAAGALWGLDGCREIIEVTVAGSGGRAMKGVTVHRTRALPQVDRGEQEGIPVTRPARTLIDLAAVLDQTGLEAALDSALRERLVTPGYLGRRLHGLGGNGRDGVAGLRQLVEDRLHGRPADSRRENDIVRQLAAAGLPSPERQFPFEGLRFDLAYPRVRIAVEFDSYRHHYGRRSWRRDRSRHNRATAAGWLVFHLTEGEGVAAVVSAYRLRSAA